MCKRDIGSSAGRTALVSVLLLVTIGPLVRPTVSRAAGPAGISDPALSLINGRTSQNRTQFFVYQDMDSGFNHGFPSGLFGSSQSAMSKLHLDPGCVYSSGATNGCSTNPTILDRNRGTVFRISFDPLSAGQFVGLNFEEPEHWGASQSGRGYNLVGATQLLVDVISPTGGINVQFSIAGATTSYVSIPQQWTTITINLASLGLSSATLSGVHLLFGIASNDFNAPNGGTVLLDNIRFQPVPTSQNTALGFPLANQVFGILHVSNTLPGSVPIPPDQVNANLTTVYESSMAILALLGRGQPQDVLNAKLIADTLVYALGHDNQGDPLPVAADGSTALHNGMFSGDIALFNSQGFGSGQQGQVKLTGFTAPTLCPQTGFCLVLDGASGGNNAFAVLGLLAAHAHFQDPSYLTAAITIGNWIYGKLLDTSGTGYGGYFVGYPDEGAPKLLLTGKSVENNADIFQAFEGLANIERRRGNIAVANEWTRRANIAGDFVMQMFDSVAGRFFAGTVPPSIAPARGITPNGPQRGNDVINTFDFLDAQTFTTLPLAIAPRYRNQIDWRRPIQWLVSHFARSITVAGDPFQGFDLIESADHLPLDGPTGIAWEFTAQAVVAMRLVDSLYSQSQFTALADSYLAQIRKAQTSAPFADGFGVVASTLQDGQTVPPYQQCLVTPFQCIPERVGLAATLWAIFADQNINPFAIKVPASGGVFRSGFWAIDNRNWQWDASDRYVWLGQAGDIPLAGDFDGDGVMETGIFRNGFWAIEINHNGQWDGGDLYVWLGQAGDIPVVGDFNGDGRDEMGVFRSGFWAIDMNHNGQWDVSDKYVWLGQAGDVPVVGDFNSDGIIEMGVFRNGFWAIDMNRNGVWDATDKYVWLGQAGDVPVVGDFNGDGVAEIGVFRNGFWAVDLNKNGLWDANDGYYWLGQGGDVPVVLR